MNKQQLITRNPGVKLYDLSDPIDLHRMNMNLHYCSKKGKEPTFKLTAPFGHSLKFKADFYYFESENTPISEQILEEMGFVQESDFNHWFLRLNDNSFVIEINRINIVYLEYEKTKIKTANQLHTLIELLS